MGFDSAIGSFAQSNRVKRDRFLRDQGYEVIRIDGYYVTRKRASVRKRIEVAVDERMNEE